MKRQITFAGACYDRTQALIDGTVAVNRRFVSRGKPPVVALLPG